MINGGREWVNDVKEDTVAEFTKGKYTMVGIVSCFSLKLNITNLNVSTQNVLICLLGQALLVDFDFGTSAVFHLLN